MATLSPGRALGVDAQLHTALFLIGERDGAIARNELINLLPPGTDFSNISQYDGDPAIVGVAVRNDATGDNFRLVFAATAGSMLLPGTYSGATDVVFAPHAANPGIRVSGNGKACGGGVGEFTVHELTLDGAGQVEVLAVDFRYACGDTLASGNVLKGQLRISSAFGWSGWHTPLKNFGFGSQRVATTSDRGDVSVRASGSGPALLTASVVGPHATDFTLHDDDGCTAVPLSPGEECTLGVTFMPSVNAARIAELRISSDGGLTNHSVHLAGVGQLATTTLLVDAPADVVYPHGFTVSGSLTPSAAPGNISFGDLAEVYGSSNVIGGHASSRVVLRPGVGELYAHYLGSTNYEPSSSRGAAINVLLATQAAVRATNTTPRIGQPVDVHASLRTLGGHLLSGGTLSIVDADTETVLATVPVNGFTGEASVRIRYFETGEHRLEARYSGHGVFAASTSWATVAVEKIPTTMQVQLQNPAHFPQSITLRATISPIPDGGTLTFYAGSTVLGTAVPDPATGTGTLTLSLTPGTRPISVAFSGTPYFGARSAGPISHRVSIATASSLSANPAVPQAGSPFTITSQVTGVGAAHPSAGTLTLVHKGTNAVLATAAVTETNRQVETTVTLAQGTHTFEVSYTGAGDHDPSKATLNVSVGPPADQSPPTGTVAINGGAAFTASRDVVLGLSAVDAPPGSGVTHMRLGSRPSGSWSAWQPFSQSAAWKLESGDGTHSVYVQVRDGAGNVSATSSASIVLDTTPPSTSSVSEAFVVGSTVKKKLVPVELGYPATDATSGVTRYEVGRSVNGGAFTTLAIPQASSATRVELASGSDVYRFRTRARDAARNWSPWIVAPSFQVTRTEEAAAAVKYAGTWKIKSSKSASGGRYRQSANVGATATFTFTGRDLAVVMRVGPTFGRADVLVDGIGKRLDLYAPTHGWRRVVLAATWDSAGVHVVKVVVLGTKSAASSGKAVALDAFVVVK